MSQYILGIRPDYDGLIVDPVIPKSWDGFSVKRKFRGAELQITVKNPGHVNRGVKELVLNGEVLKGNIIPAAGLKKNNQVGVLLG
jgi:cellobiose phosphorylase